MTTATASPAGNPEPRVYRTQLTERQVLDYFWAACRDGADRLQLLMQISVVAVPAPDGWQPKQVRAEFRPRPYPSSGCFACRRRDRRLAWHHIVAIDHGGSNWIWNLVAVCHVCHRRIHPWLEEEPDDGRWTRVRQLVSQIGERRLEIGITEEGHLVPMDPKQRQQRMKVLNDDGRGTSSVDADEEWLYQKGEWE